ncbi:DUF3923 family protein [Bacillus sp. JJ722]|uniref:DUF3923 family protein n=1 Tax=Bacillus sp. JJ722 TaxID=3122973 RepID=UPI002FFE7E77
MKMKTWWITNAVWIVILGALGLFLGLRQVDGAGVIQTPEVRMMSFTIYGEIVIAIVIIQLILLFFVKKNENNQ